MKEEYLDIVDEDNNLTGKKKLRLEVHGKGYLHRTVHIYFFREKNNNFEFLVHLRSKTKDLHPNCWDTRFGGHIKSGDSIMETVVGEIREELGVDVDFDHLIQGEVKKGGVEFNHIYFYEFIGEIRELKFDDGEVQAVKWLGINEIEIELENNPTQWTSNVASFRDIIKDFNFNFQEHLKNKAKYLD